MQGIFDKSRLNSPPTCRIQNAKVRSRPYLIRITLDIRIIKFFGLAVRLARD